MESVQLTPSDSLDVVDSVDHVERDDDTDTVWATYDAARDDVSLAVVAIVATVEDRALTDIQPLQSAVDVDALQRLFNAPADRLPTPTSTTFRYEGYEVTVSSDELIQVTPLDAI
jgi:hypothetical protein